MLNDFANVFSAHPVAISAAAIGIIIILIWMTGSGSRQRFIVLKRTKETDALARDLGRIASALEKISKQRDIPTDYVGRPIPPGWEDTISSGEPAEPELAAEPVAAGNPAAAQTPADPAVEPAELRAPAKPAPVPASRPSAIPNPLGGAASLLGGKKKLDLPNPMYRPK